MHVQVGSEISVSHRGNDGLRQMLLRLKYRASHTLPKSAIGLLNSFNAVKVRSAGTRLALVCSLPNTSVTDHASNPYVTTFVARLWEVVGKQNTPMKS